MRHHRSQNAPAKPRQNPYSVVHPCAGMVRQSVLVESPALRLPHNDAEEVVESALNNFPARNGQSCADHDPGLRALGHDVRAKRRTQRRPHSYPPLSTPNVLQRLTHSIGSESGQFDVRDCNDALSALLQGHRGCGDLYFKPPIPSANIEGLARFDVECLAKRFGDDDSPSRVDGGFHGMHHGKKMVLRQTMRFWRPHNALISND